MFVYRLDNKKYAKSIGVKCENGFKCLNRRFGLNALIGKPLLSG